MERGISIPIFHPVNAKTPPKLGGAIINVLVQGINVGVGGISSTA